MDPKKFIFSSTHSLIQSWWRELLSIAKEECSKALVVYYFLSCTESTKERLDPTTLEAKFKKTTTGDFRDLQENFIELGKKIVSCHPNIAYGYFLASLDLFRSTKNQKEVLNKEWLGYEMSVALAENATKLAPNSVEYSLYYASLVYAEIQSVRNKYKDVIQECERGLLIENPQDPINKWIWSKELGKDRGFKDTGVWTRMVSEYNKGKIRELMAVAKRTYGEEEIFVGKDVQQMGEDFLMSVLKSTKEDIDARFMAWEAFKLRFGSPVEARNIEDMSPVQRKPADDDRKRTIMEFWKEMNVEKRKGMLKVSIAKLKLYFGYSRNNSVMDVLNEAIEYVKKERKWVRWFCYSCEEVFADSESWKNHVKSEHIGELEPRLQEMEPELAGNEWTTNIENGVWKPMNMSETSESQSGLESKAAENDVKKRAELIRSVHGLMKSLMTDKCLATSHFEKLMAILQTCFTELRVVDYGLDSICLLNVPQLKKVLGFLKGLASSCGLICYTKNMVSHLRHVLCVEEGIFLSIDLLSLILDKRSFPEAPYTGTWLTDPKDYQGVIFSVDCDDENIEFPESDAFINWLCSAPTLEVHLDRLKILKEGSKLQVNNLLKTVEEEFKKLKSSCEMKAKLKGLSKEVQSERTDEELGELDAKILAGVRLKQQAMQKLELLCCWDYRVDMVHLLKLFILNKLKNAMLRPHIKFGSF